MSPQTREAITNILISEYVFPNRIYACTFTYLHMLLIIGIMSYVNFYIYGFLKNIYVIFRHLKKKMILIPLFQFSKTSLWSESLTCVYLSDLSSGIKETIL